MTDAYPTGRRGLLFVISSPSGAGKTTLSKRLLASDAGLRLSVSMTTRAPRPGEVDGADYHFVDEARFRSEVAAGALIEWAEVFGNLYGTPRAPVAAALAKGWDVLFDVDWQGARQLAAAMPDDVVRVFILPPSAPALEQRLVQRAQDSAEVVARRMAKAADEIAHWADYDYAVLNDDLERSHATLASILAAERARRARQIGLAGFVAALQADLAAMKRASQS
ncbi:MAG: guanylate kinase [Hyphomicrobiaceae bacterium]|nr:guanylate kinase [Hyphomicrobiaceae bacterium]